VIYFTAGLFIENILKELKPGQRIANSEQGGLSFEEMNSKFQKIGINKAVFTARVFSRVLQRWRKVERITIPYVSDFFELATEKELSIYKGVSFNPSLLEAGEKFNLLDFFGWIKFSGLKSIIINASAYAIVNQGKIPLAGNFSKYSGKEAVNFLKAREVKYTEIRELSDIRNDYLKAIASSQFLDEDIPLILSAKEMWKSPEYAKCLQEAIGFCAGNPSEGEAIVLKKSAKYKRYGEEYQRWYSPLVLAEALFLYRKYGVNVKLGPTTESNFDSLIREFMREKKIKYAFIWYDRTIENKVSSNDSIGFSDSKQTVKKKLSNPLVKAWAEEIVTPFKQNPSEKLENRVYDMISRVNAEKLALSRNLNKKVLIS